MDRRSEAMKRFAALILVLAVSACGKRAEPKPIVHVQVVETHPFDDGYSAGFAAGKAAGKPRTKLPTPDRTTEIAAEEAARDPERNEKWQRGFAEGYMDGFRLSSTGQK